MRGSIEAPQDQVVLHVMPGVPDRYILEQTTVCAQYVVGPGAQLPAALVHGPSEAFIQLQPGDAVFFLVLKNLLTPVLFAATREINIHFVSCQGLVEIALKSIAKSVINK